MEFQNILQIQKNNFLEEISIDVNDILNFSINIDNLKIFLTTLLKNQTALSNKIIELENKIQTKIVRGSSIHSKDKDKDKSRRRSSIKLARKNLINQNIQDEKRKKRMSVNLNKLEFEKFMNNKTKNIENTKKDNGADNLEEEKEKETEKEKIQENIDDKGLPINGSENKIEEKDEEVENEEDNQNKMEIIKEETDEKKTESKEQDINLESDLSDSYDSQFFDLQNKFYTLEKKVKNLEILNKVNKFTGQGIDKSDDIQLMQIEINNLKDSNAKLNQENLEFKKQIENINVKLADINIFDLFKDLNLNEGSVDVAKALVINLEKKVFQKIAFMDDRDKKINQDIMDLKTKIQNVINKNGVISHSMDSIKNNFKELGQLVSTNNIETTNLINSLETKNNNMHKELIEKFDTEKNDINLKIKKITDKLFNLEKLNNQNLNANNLKSNSNIEFTEENLELIQKMANRISEIESKINSMLELSQSFSSKDDLIKIEKELIKKVNTKEFFELKDKYNLQLAKINNLEDSIERLQDLNEKNSSDLIFYAKRIEVLTSNMISIRGQVEELIENEKKKIIDLSKYLEKSNFMKHLKSLQPEQAKIENNFEEIRNLINEMGIILTKKCSADDLKCFEDIINSKLEESKLTNTKKFADKIDTNRSIKYLESQIKHIVDVYIKKVDKNESWLIAKKPMGGFSCASCESYLGELKNKEGYMPWNKYPQREKDQNYRVGNGFSRMLNMLNIELKNNDLSMEKENDSDDEVKKYFEENRIKIRIKNSTSQRDIFNAKNKSNNNMSALLKNNSNNNMLISNPSSKNTNTNILPKLYLNKNDEIQNLESNSQGVNDYGLDRNSNETNLEEINKETNELQPHIVKIIKKSKNNINLPEASKTDRNYSTTKK